MSALVTLDEVKNYLSINSTTNDSRLSNLIVYASDLVEAYCSRGFAAANVSYEYQNGGYSYVLVNRPPINIIYSLSEYDGGQYVPMVGVGVGGGLPNTAANANSAPGYTYSPSSGKIQKGFATNPSAINTTQSFANYPSGVRIEYNGGYATIPNDVKMCVLDIVKSLHKGIEAHAVRFNQEFIEQQPYSAGFPPHIRRVLDLYRLIV